MIFQKGTNWNDLDAGLKRGRMVIKTKYKVPNPNEVGAFVERTRWVVTNPPIFTKEKEFLINLIPDMKGIAND